MKRPLILISNDDGFRARGINELTEIAQKYGDVVVAAPSGPRSAQSGALTIETPVWVKKYYEAEGVIKYSINGTPADCVKLAIAQLLDRKPDLVLTGINHGSNASINVIYSGTVGAALEGCIHEIPSIAFSLCTHDEEADFSTALPYFDNLIKQVLADGLPTGVCLNVNAPTGDIKGVRACRQASGVWEKDFVKTSAPRPLDYYWLVGDFKNTDTEDINADQTAVENGYITIVPIKPDMTAYSALEFCKRYEK